MSRLPRLTVRTRLTLLYTGLFAICGAIVVAVSYSLVARLEPAGQGRPAPANFLRLCRSEQLSAHPDTRVLGKCGAYFALQGAQRQRNLTLSHLLQYSLITLAVVIALGAILGWIAAGRALRPVHRITAAARTASEHNLSARVASRGPRDELRELAETFDEMLGRLQAAFEGQQRFIANASHELRTPLAVMRTTVDVVLGNPDCTPDDLRGMAADIRVAVDHAEHLIGALLILARNERGLTVQEEVDLATVAEDVLDAADPGDRRVHATLEPAVMSGDPVLAERLIANLVDNAARYNGASGDIWINTRTAAGSIELTVANTGPFIQPADAERIFQPFERLNDDTSREGSGLGLTIVASIAAIHGGSATARPRDGGGLSVTVTMPAAGTRAYGTRQRSSAIPGTSPVTHHVVLSEDLSDGGAGMAEELPDVIRRYQDAHDSHDVDGALAPFGATATVRDDGQQWVGTTEIRSWLTKTSTEYTYTRTLLGAETTADGSWDVRNRLEGNFPGSVVDLHYRFELAGDQILSLTIAP